MLEFFKFNLTDGRHTSEQQQSDTDTGNPSAAADSSERVPIWFCLLARDNGKLLAGALKF